MKRCYECNVTPAGKVDWGIWPVYRSSSWSCDEEGVHSGQWSGKKLLHPSLRHAGHQKDYTGRGKTDIWVHVEAFSQDYRLRRRVTHFTCYLMMDTCRLDVIRHQKISSLTLLKRKIDRMDFSAEVAALLRQFYSPGNDQLTQVWSANPEYQPLMTTFTYLDGFQLPMGNYAVKAGYTDLVGLFERTVYGWCGSVSQNTSIVTPWIA